MKNLLNDLFIGIIILTIVGALFGLFLFIANSVPWFIVLFIITMLCVFIGKTWNGSHDSYDPWDEGHF